MEWRMYSRTGRVYGARFTERALVDTSYGRVEAKVGDYLVVDDEGAHIRHVPQEVFDGLYRPLGRPVPLKALGELSRVAARNVTPGGGAFGQTCVRCGERRTGSRFEGIPTCTECELEIKADREESAVCPVDGTGMEKRVVHNLIVDRCPECGGVWFDGGELDLVGSALAAEAAAGAGSALAGGILRAIAGSD